jgi:hypothetical protein
MQRLKGEASARDAELAVEVPVGIEAASEDSETEGETGA